MSRLEQRCRGVVKIFDDYNIKYKKKYDDPKYLHFIYKGRGWDLEISNKYITVEYKKDKCICFFPSFEGINEFRKFISENRDFMELEEDIV